MSTGLLVFILVGSAFLIIAICLLIGYLRGEFKMLSSSGPTKMYEEFQSIVDKKAKLSVGDKLRLIWQLLWEGF